MEMSEGITIAVRSTFFNNECALVGVVEMFSIMSAHYLVGGSGYVLTIPIYRCYPVEEFNQLKSLLLDMKSNPCGKLPCKNLYQGYVHCVYVYLFLPIPTCFK